MKTLIDMFEGGPKEQAAAEIDRPKCGHRESTEDFVTAVAEIGNLLELMALCEANSLPFGRLKADRVRTILMHKVVEPSQVGDA